MFWSVVLASQVETVPLADGSLYDFTWLFLKMMAALIVVCVGAILVLKYAVPRMRVFRRFQDKGQITVEDKIALTSKAYVYIVRAAGERLLLGVTEQSVGLICKLDGGQDGGS